MITALLVCIFLLLLLMAAPKLFRLLWIIISTVLVWGVVLFVLLVIQWGR